jgi:hypothetical protein
MAENRARVGGESRGQAAFRCGWNDLANGVIDWVDQERWPSALAWVIHMRELAGECKRRTSVPNRYYDGVIAAAKEYEQTGKIWRM